MRQTVLKGAVIGLLIRLGFGVPLVLAPLYDPELEMAALFDLPTVGACFALARVGLCDGFNNDVHFLSLGLLTWTAGGGLIGWIIALWKAGSPRQVSGPLGD